MNWYRLFQVEWRMRRAVAKNKGRHPDLVSMEGWEDPVTIADRDPGATDEPKLSDYLYIGRPDSWRRRSLLGALLGGPRA